MDLSILANIGTLNSLNGAIPKDSSYPKLNHPILSTTTNTANGYAYSFLSTTCSMLAAMMPLKNKFKDSVCNHFDVKFLGPAKWFLQMRIHQHKDKSYTLDQHLYILNTFQCYNLNLEFPERKTPYPPDYTFSKDNRPVNNHDKHIIEERHKRLPFRSAVCTLLYLAYNTCANILSAVCKLAKACICPGKANLHALIWLKGWLPTKTPILCHQVLPRRHLKSCLRRMLPIPHTTLRPERIFQHQLARLPTLPLDI